MTRNDQGRRTAKDVAETRGHDIGAFRWQDEPLGAAFPGGAYVAHCQREGCPVILAHANDVDGYRQIRWVRTSPAATSTGPVSAVPGCTDPVERSPRRIPGVAVADA